jgi:hypothetical protein
MLKGLQEFLFRTEDIRLKEPVWPKSKAINLPEMEVLDAMHFATTRSTAHFLRVEQTRHKIKKAD